MVPGRTIALLVAGFLVTLALEWLALAASRRLGVVAEPNPRSSHVHPTPTAGGVAFVVPLVAYLAWLATQGAAAAGALAAGGVLLAAVGLADDLRDLSARLRILLHMLVAAGVVWLALPELGWFVLALLAVALVWQINLYNFMDGIDGLAGAQALVLLVGGLVIAGGVPGWAGDVGWLGAGCMVGFLVFNWPPARIFMGDVGSGFLGLLTGAWALALWQQGALPLVASLILLSGFWFDASYTLIVRVTSGQPFTQPHRSHLYQKLAAKRGHSWTTSCYLFFAALWLLPLAWLSSRHGFTPLPDLVYLVAAIAPLAVAARVYRAGAR